MLERGNDVGGTDAERERGQREQRESRREGDHWDKEVLSSFTIQYQQSTSLLLAAILARGR